MHSERDGNRDMQKGLLIDFIIKGRNEETKKNIQIIRRHEIQEKQIVCKREKQLENKATKNKKIAFGAKRMNHDRQVNSEYQIDTIQETKLRKKETETHAKEKRRGTKVQQQQQQEKQMHRFYKHTVENNA